MSGGIDDYPAAFRKFAVLPRADENKAGFKDPDMNRRGKSEPAIQAQAPAASREFDPFVVDPTLVPDAVVESRRTQVQAAARQARKKIRLTMETGEGQFSMHVAGVKKGRYSVLVMIPLSEEVSVFTPRLGSRLTLSWQDTSVGAVYPGAYVEVPELELGFMTFIIDEEK